MTFELDVAHGAPNPPYTFLVHLLIIADYVSAGECPRSHPYVYLYGQFCCASHYEKFIKSQVGNPPQSYYFDVILRKVIALT